MAWWTRDVYESRLAPLASAISAQLGKTLPASTAFNLLSKLLASQSSVRSLRDADPFPASPALRSPRWPVQCVFPPRFCATRGREAGCRSSSLSSPRRQRCVQRRPALPAERCFLLCFVCFYFLLPSRPPQAPSLESLRRELAARGALPPLRVFFAAGTATGEERLRLDAVVQRFGGTVVEDEAAATHTLHPPAAAEAAEAGRSVVRVVDAQGEAVLLHTVGAPHSEDCWVARGEAPEGGAEAWEAGASAAAPPRWSLPSSWLTCSDACSELLPEADFELSTPAAAKGGTKRAPAAEGGEAAKRARLTPLPGILPRAAPLLALQDGAIAAASHGDGAAAAQQASIRVENLSSGQRPHPAVAPPRLPPSGPLPPVAPPAPGEPPLVPAYASWFRFKALAEIERRSLSEFFGAAGAEAGSLKNQSSYRAMRNAIVQRFREDPSRRITFAECRPSLVGDLNGMQRIFTFLEHWGIINHIPTKAGPVANARPPPAARAAQDALALPAEAAEPEAVRVMAGAGGARAAHFLFEFDPVRSGIAPGSVQLPPGVGVPPRSTAPPIRAATRRREPSGLPALVCNACGCDLSAQPRYHCLKLPDFDLCAAHYAAGRFLGGMSSSDFARVEVGAAPPASPAGCWSDAETLRLLEGMEARGEDWTAVAAHVGTKSAQQCLTHFLALPIEDRFLDQMEGRPSAPPAPPDAPAPALLPFEDAGNPLMAQVAFMAAIVGPRVAAAAAQAALAALEADCGDPGEAVARAAAAAEAGVAAMELDGAPLDGQALRRSAAVSLTAAAVKAKLLADHEEREAQRLVVSLVTVQLQKIDSKTKLLAELDVAAGCTANGVDRLTGTYAADHAAMAAWSLQQQPAAVTVAGTTTPIPPATTAPAQLFAPAPPPPTS